MSDRFAFGDRVRHPKRPEWGIGAVVKAEDVAANGAVGSQRLSVRFSGAGVKTLSTAHASLERVTDERPAPAAGDEEPAVAHWDQIGESEWLAGVAAKKIEEAMTCLPEQATDRFVDLRRRLTFMVGLYRFERTGRGLVDWAVAQTGLEDPLSRFNRHELEQYFDRWAYERDAHLGRLIAEAKADRGMVDSVLANGPSAARKAAKKANGAR